MGLSVSLSMNPNEMMGATVSEIEDQEKESEQRTGHVRAESSPRDPVERAMLQEDEDKKSSVIKAVIATSTANDLVHIEENAAAVVEEKTRNQAALELREQKALAFEEVEKRARARAHAEVVSSKNPNDDNIANNDGAQQVPNRL